MRLFVKNMVSLRCKLIVKQELEKLHLDYIMIELGEVEMREDISDELREQLGKNLCVYGLELMDDPKKILIEKIKGIIIESIHYDDEPIRVNFSTYLSEKLQYDYNYLSNLFSEVKGITIEQFIIAHKIERVKELLIYDGLSLTEIAYKMHYSSVAHLSNQFKKVTGLTPSFFRKLKDQRLKGRENV